MKTKNAEHHGINKFFIVSAINVILVLAIGIIFIYAPYSNKDKSLRADILRERDKNLLIGKIKALNKYIKVYNKRMAEDGGVSWLLGEISSMAAKERIEVSSIKPLSPEDYGLYTKLFVAVDMVSTYNQFGKFISAMESSEKFLKVENANIRRLDIDEKFVKGSGKFKAFDIRANVVISTIVPKE